MKARKFLSAVLSLVMILTALPLAAVNSFAETSGDFEYKILDNGTAEITGYTGNATELAIPSTLDGYTVTKIGSGIFYCSNITTLTIPNSVIHIGAYAFSHCGDLTNITLPNSKAIIDEGAFYFCDSLVSVTIPDSTIRIGTAAFNSCFSLAEITIPDSDIISIGLGAFSDTAYSYNEKNWEEGALYIGKHLIAIDKEYDRETDTYITTVPSKYSIKAGTLTIADKTFYNRASVTSITIPNSVTSIGSGAFSGCYSLTLIKVNEANKNYCSVNGVLFKKDKTELIGYPAGKTDTSYIIPDSVTNIREWAFSGCSSIESITIPGSVTNVGEGAFHNCTSLENVIIPDSITSIGDEAFENCTSLENVIIPDSITSIGDEAFENCTSLKNITIGNSVKNIGKWAFSKCSSIESITIPNSVTSIGEGAFQLCTSLTSITIPDGVIGINSLTFYNTAYCNNTDNWQDGVLYIGSYLIDIDTKYDWQTETYTTTVPENYKIKDGTITIVANAFSDCHSLKSITIPDSVTSIGDEAFENCTSLESVAIPDSVTNIGVRAFEDCTSLTSITIPDSVTSVGDEAFGYYFNKDLYETEKIGGFTIYGYEGSEAERYANDNEFIFIALEREPMPTPEKPADLNGDGNVTVVDAKWTLQAVANSRALTDEQRAAADVNGDGKVTVVDAKWILQAVAGMRVL